MREMIRQYYNYPSIVIWAYMNEMFLGAAWKKDREQIRKIVASCPGIGSLNREEDPYAFYDDSGTTAILMFTTSPYLTRIPMIVGWNLYARLV